jgi:energy-coupling factor transporter ATP-binding protein EcfA2
MSRADPLFNAVRLPTNATKHFEVLCSDPEVSAQWIGPLASLNVFVGPNNCGKSRLLRTLFENFVPHEQLPAGDLRSLVLPGGAPWSDLLDQARKARVSLKPLFEKIRKDDALWLEIRSGRLRWMVSAIEGDVGFIHFVLEANARRWNQWPFDCQDAFHALISRTGGWESDEKQAFRESIAGLTTAFNQAHAQWPPPAFATKRVYIPVLRSLRPAALAQSPEGVLVRNDTFELRTAQDYFKWMVPEIVPNGRRRDEVRVSTGQSYFNDILEAASGTPDQRRLLASFESFLGDRFFGGQAVELTPRVRGEGGQDWNNVLHIKVGSGEERPIHHLGDGLSHLIIMTWPLFLYQSEKLLLFIEEPELFLHPGFQRLLIESFLNLQSEQGRQVFVSTHSNQFLDATLDTDRVSVFALSKQAFTSSGTSEAPFAVRPRSNASRPLLRELGVLNSSVLLANCTVWVEGVSDRTYLRHYLRLLMDQAELTAGNGPYYEDIHYAFVEYSGSNITHLSFLDEKGGINPETLCGELCLIADSDNASPESTKGKRHVRLKTLLGDERFRVLRSREMENLLMPAVIESVVLDYTKQERSSLRAAAWPEYRSEKLGKFIDNHVVDTAKRKFADEYGCLRGKPDFAERAVTFMTKWEHLSDEAQDLSKWVFEFIRSRNTGPKYISP